VAQALDNVRPHLESHGGNVELMKIDSGVVRLRLQGSCRSCASSADTLKLAVEAAIYAAAPDVVSIEAEGLLETPSTTGFVQISRPGPYSITNCQLPVQNIANTGRPAFEESSDL